MLNCDESVSKNYFVKKENIMVVKKKGLYLGLLVALLGIGNVTQAYKLTIVNETPFKIKFEVNYLGEVKALKSCRTDKGELAPGKRKIIHSGLCLVTLVEADVFERRRYDTSAGKRGSLRRVVKAKSYKASWGRAGNTTWLVQGPIEGVPDKYYTVTVK